VTRTAAQIRQEFLDFFRARGHAIVPSSPVVPLDDPTLLFTNAGMNQFKPYFLGLETPKFRRAADTQKCIRAGGKHNDLDDVGHDTYHHTFFEMLGNWSFGDYFKKDAIAWAWELLVDVWGIDSTRLHATYFGGDAAEGLDADLEARDLWRQILPPERVHAGSKKDNFWEMGETGPCGPCSEIHIDLTPDKSGAKLVNAGDARVIEIWNLVFIQFNRAADGKLTPLPAKHVDTGMGFERVTAVLQGHNNNYATDVFVPILQAIERISGYRYGERHEGTEARRHEGNRYACFVPGDMRDESCRVIADHIRCLTFAITDGATPDKEGRGYVLRRILRRAVRYGWQYLNLHEPFLHKLVPAVVEVMGEAFPELRKNPEHVQDILRDEEESFGRTLERGLALFEKAVAEAVGRAIEADMQGAGWVFLSAEPFENQGAWQLNFGAPRSVGHFGPQLVLSKLDRPSIELHTKREVLLSGEDAFKLHDTYGFPIDLTELMANERGVRVDISEYERLMQGARERSRSVAKRFLGNLQSYWERAFGATDDAAKYACTQLRARVRAIIRAEEARAEVVDVDAMILGEGTLLMDLASVEAGEPLPAGTPVRAKGLSVGANAGVVLDKTCFYAEQGGQVGDAGTICTDSGEVRVENTVRFGTVVVHFGVVSAGVVKHGQDCVVTVNPSREHTRQNHTATHVMNWALREVLGEHVQQKGSLVDHEKTRFDFSHPKPLTPEEIERVEQLVNERVRANLPVYYKVVPQQDALKINGLRAVFGERYPDMVRVMSVGVKVEDLIKKPDNPEWRKYSIEFCGGTHLNSTGQIEHFTITTEEAVAKGIRRIVAVTGETARRIEEAGNALVQRAEQLKRGPADAVAGGLAELQSTLATATVPLRQRHRLRELMAELQAIVKQQQKSDAADAAEIVKREVATLLEQAEKIGGTTVVVGEMPDVPIDQLKMGADLIKQKCGSAAVLFGVTERRSDEATKGGGKAVLLAAMTPDLVKKGLKAGDLVKAIAPLIGGGGGGPPTMAQAGGKQPEKLGEALEAGRDWIRSRLSGA
jgi:alanyl-tRNA synthetase